MNIPDRFGLPSEREAYRRKKEKFMSVLSTVEEAAAGSPTAKALLDQIRKEERESAELAFQMQLAERQRQGRLEQERIEGIKAKAAEILAKYDELRDQLENLVIEVARLDLELPFTMSNRIFPEHLRYVHLPPSVLGKMDISKPIYSTMESKLMGLKL